MSSEAQVREWIQKFLDEEQILARLQNLETARLMADPEPEKPDGE